MNEPLLLTMAASEPYTSLVTLTSTRHEQYCRRYGFRFQIARPKMQDLAKTKIRRIRDYLVADGPEFVFYLDADALISDLSVDLRSSLPEGAWLGLSAAPISSERTTVHLNCGCMYVRNCAPARAFFTRVLELMDELPDPKNWNEQNAINHALYDEPKWQSGFVLLGHEWNDWRAFAPYAAFPTDRTIVAAWHGASRKLDLMRAYLAGLPA